MTASMQSIEKGLAGQIEVGFTRRQIGWIAQSHERQRQRGVGGFRGWGGMPRFFITTVQEANSSSLLIELTHLSITTEHHWDLLKVGRGLAGAWRLVPGVCRRKVRCKGDSLSANKVHPTTVEEKPFHGCHQRRTARA
jgi:hypothetical protein